MQIVAWFIAAFLIWAPALQAATIEQQRDWFQQARKALNHHNKSRFQTLKAKLQDYPLTPYLDIWHARKSLKQNNDKLAAKTLARHADIPESYDLRRAWVLNLANRGAWRQVDKILKQSPHLAARLPETSMTTRWHMGDKKRAMRDFSSRWQRARPVSGFTKPLYQAWLQQGHPTLAERWQRIMHQAQRGKWHDVRRISKSFKREHKLMLTYWRKLQKKPESSLRDWQENITPVLATAIFSDGIKRLSRKDPAKAWQLLQNFKRHVKNVPLLKLAELERYTALRAAKRHIPEAADWLNSLLLSLQNEDTRSWQARLAILAADWQATLDIITLMPENEQAQSRWIYWQAHALKELGHEQQATPLFARLADDRGYYSFLSAEHLGRPFSFDTAGFQASEAKIAELEGHPAVRRAYEWLQLDYRNKAAREWHSALADADNESWQAAAILASRWDWHDQVIRAAFKADRLDALLARFPLSHEKSVLKASAETGLMPAEIWSIIRQESAFNQQAVSYVGAKGLMQLMPKTARQVARKLGMGKRTPRLFSPAVNIRLGSTYLAKQKERFGNLALASAAYNAGPHRVSKWLERTPFDSALAWVEAIPFNETRRYVQQVMAFVSVYEWRQDKQPTSLISRLNKQRQEISLNEYRLGDAD